MMHVGLDLSRKRVDVHVMDAEGDSLLRTSCPPDAGGLRGLAARLDEYGEPIRAVIESMNGARFVHDQLEEEGWEVDVADAQRVKGLAPLACKTDRIDARVLAELSWRNLVPAIWLPSPAVRGERERARWRLHLVRHRVALKNRVHAVLMAHGITCPMSDLFGVAGRRRLGTLQLPDPWAQNVVTALELIDELDERITRCEADLQRLGIAHPYVSLLVTVPGISWILGYTIASEIGDITRFPSAKHLVGYTGLCPRVYQSGESDRRGPLSKAGPPYLRWALIEAATNACWHDPFRRRYQATKQRLGKQKGSKVARVELARRLTEAIWHMLTRNQAFRSAGPSSDLTA